MSGKFSISALEKVCNTSYNNKTLIRYRQTVGSVHSLPSVPTWQPLSPLMYWCRCRTFVVHSGWAASWHLAAARGQCASGKAGTPARTPLRTESSSEPRWLWLELSSVTLHPRAGEGPSKGGDAVRRPLVAGAGGFQRQQVVPGELRPSNNPSDWGGRPPCVWKLGVLSSVFLLFSGSDALVLNSNFCPKLKRMITKICRFGP